MTDGTDTPTGRPHSGGGPSASTPPPDLVADLAPTGVLRAVVNLGNPVLAQGSAQAPRGVTVDLAAEVARRLGVEVAYRCVDAARDSFAALTDARADVGFLAVEPARAEQVAFTAPYAVIEGVYVVPRDSPLHASVDVDRVGTRVGVKRGSAYDLFLTRTLERATVVRGEEGSTVFLEEGLEVGAGIRGPVTELVAARADLRLLEPAFSQIRQAVAVSSLRRAATVRWVTGVVAELVRTGFVTESLHRSGRTDAVVPGPE